MPWTQLPSSPQFLRWLEAKMIVWLTRNVQHNQVTIHSLGKGYGIHQYISNYTFLLFGMEDGLFWAGDSQNAFTFHVVLVTRVNSDLTDLVMEEFIWRLISGKSGLLDSYDSAKVLCCELDEDSGGEKAWKGLGGSGMKEFILPNLSYRRNDPVFEILSNS